MKNKKYTIFQDGEKVSEHNTIRVTRKIVKKLKAKEKKEKKEAKEKKTKQPSTEFHLNVDWKKKHSGNGHLQGVSKDPRLTCKHLFVSPKIDKIKKERYAILWFFTPGVYGKTLFINNEKIGPIKKTHLVAHEWNHHFKKKLKGIFSAPCVGKVSTKWIDKVSKEKGFRVRDWSW